MFKEENHPQARAMFLICLSLSIILYSILLQKIIFDICLGPASFKAGFITFDRRFHDLVS